MGDKSGIAGGRTDMEVLGVFNQMGYISINDKYKSQSNRPFNDAAAKGKQMLSMGNKERCGTLDGYFDKSFVRMLAGESYNDPIKRRRQHNLKEAKKNLGLAFVPCSGDKKPSGLGSYYGCFGRPLSAFKYARKPRPPYKAEPRNFTTNPGKLGTGYGYPMLTIDKNFTYSPTKYSQGNILRKKERELHKAKLIGSPFKESSHPRELFDNNPFGYNKVLPPVKKTPPAKTFAVPFRPSHPGKSLASSKAGISEPYPAHSADIYKPKPKRKHVPVNSSGTLFFPFPGPKSKPSSSIALKNAARGMNSTNFRTYQVTASV